MNTAAARFVLPIALVAGAAQPALAAAKPEPVYVAATEVTLKNRKEKRADEVAQALRTASTEESHYYDPAQRPVTMRIQIDKMGFKSAGKAMAQMLPLIGMFAGSNRNMMKGQVELVDQTSGRSLKKFKIECDDDTDFSGSDAALAYGKIGLSFLPFGSLISSAMDVAEGAANKRDKAEQMLTKGFVMLSYKKAYGDKLYKSFSHQRKAAFELAKAEKKAAATAPIAAAAAVVPVAQPAPAPAPIVTTTVTPPIPAVEATR